MGHFVFLGHSNRPLMPWNYYYLSWCLIWQLHFLGKVCDPFSRHMLVWAFWLIWPKPTANVASHLSCNYRLNVPQSDNLDRWFCRFHAVHGGCRKSPPHRKILILRSAADGSMILQGLHCYISPSIVQVHLSHILYLAFGEIARASGCYPHVQRSRKPCRHHRLETPMSTIWMFIGASKCNNRRKNPWGLEIFLCFVGLNFDVESTRELHCHKDIWYFENITIFIWTGIFSIIS